MTQLPSPPFIHVDGIANFRDLGGYPIASSTTTSVKRGLIYRSADPYRVSDNGKTRLHDLKIRTVFDLRSKPEVARAVLGNVDSLSSIPGLERRFTPVFPNQDASPEALAIRYKDYAHGGVEGFTRAYRDILKNGVGAYKGIFEHLRDRPDDAILFHCSAGKDRTGVIAALTLKLAGCSDEVVAKEYQYTEKGLDPLREVIVQHLLETPSLNGNREAAIRMTGSAYESMTATMKMLRDEFGGIDGYLKDWCGFSEDDVEKIRKALVVEEKPVV